MTSEHDQNHGPDLGQNDDQDREPEMATTIREHPRIVYTAEVHPLLEMDGHAFRVIDLSERGLKFEIPEDTSPPKYISALLILACGRRLSVEGLPKWQNQNIVGVRLKDILTPEDIAAEVVYIKGKNAYVHWERFS